MEFNSVLTLILTASLFCLTSVVIFLVVYQREKRRIIRTIKSYLVQPDQETPSPLAQAVDQASIILASRLVMQLKTTVMGMNSVDAKNERKEQSQAILDQSPGLAAILKYIPGARRLVKNPELLSLAASLVNRKQPANDNHQDQAQGPSQAVFKL